MSDAVASAAPVAADAVASSEVSAAAEGAPSFDFKGTKHKIKVNGQEKEIPYEDLLAGYQLREASDAKFREAKKLHEEVQLTRKDIEEFKKNPWEFAQRNGLDPYALAEQLLLQRIEYEGLSDDAKARLRAEQEAQKLKDELEARTKAEREAAKARAAAQAVKEIDEEIGAALKELGRKPTPRLVARLAEQMLAYLDSKDGERPDARHVLKRVDQEYLGDIQEYLANLPAERLTEVLPQGIRDALRKAEVDRVMAQDPRGSRPRQSQKPSEPRQKTARMTTDDFFKQKLEKRFGA